MSRVGGQSSYFFIMFYICVVYIQDYLFAVNIQFIYFIASFTLIHRLLVFEC